MTPQPAQARRYRVRPAVWLSYAAFVLVGINVGTSGVLLLAQMGDYGVSRTAIGLTFFTGSAGFALASFGTGPLLRRFGIKTALVSGAAVFALAGFFLATRPPFAAFVVAQFLIGLAAGGLESVLNVYLAGLPGAAGLLNRLHGFFGAGALIGPVLAAWMLSFAAWPAVWLVMAIAGVPLATGFLIAAFPRREPAGLAEQHAADGREPGRPDATRQAASQPPARGLLGATLRDRGVLTGAAMLCVYVGVELSMGNWGFSYLVQARAMPGSLAGYAISGYWLGLTAGRFAAGPVSSKAGLTPGGLMYRCVAGVLVTIVLAWLAPTALLACAALVLLGFFLGPIFPTTIALAPQLTSARLQPTAIGVMNAGSVGGGSALPWLAGAIAQGSGIWTLLPFTLLLAVVQALVWRRLDLKSTSAITVAPEVT